MNAQRSKDASAKKRGFKRWVYRGLKTARERLLAARAARARECLLAARAARARIASEHAAVVAPIIAELRAAGATSLRAIAAGLNQRGVPTSQGTGKWSRTQVARAISRHEGPKEVRLARGAANARLASERAAIIAPIIAELRAAGATSLRDIVAGLIQRGIPTARGTGSWSASQVARVMERHEAAKISR